MLLIMQSLSKLSSLPCSHQIPLPKAATSASLPPTRSPDVPCKPLQVLEAWLFAFCTVCSVANYYYLGLLGLSEGCKDSTCRHSATSSEIRDRSWWGGEMVKFRLDYEHRLVLQAEGSKGKKDRDVLEPYCFFVCPLQHSRSHHLLILLLTVSLTT